VALSPEGTTALVGGPQDNGAWVFTRTAGVWTQQGPKLTGAGAVAFPSFGGSVALSADGNTALVGGFTDNGGRGAGWVFTRTAGVWTQQGPKLTGTGGVPLTQLGYSAALSADGDTALLGGPNDNGNSGAAWVFTRAAGVWTQQGSKLTGGGEAGAGQFAFAVALSADGNTALFGGPSDGASGAAWVFTRTAGVWSQQGAKLTGGGSTNGAAVGSGVALSADGNTALTGGPNDTAGSGAAWVFTRTAGVWTQQGSKLTGTGAAGGAQLGYGTGISADGNTALVGGWGDNGGVGAAWVFTRTAGVWTQQGSKLTGSGEIGGGQFGYSAAMSADGLTGLVGGFADNGAVGAAWVFAASPCAGPTITGSGLIVGTSGDDVIRGSAGADVIFGNGGNDVICGGQGADVVSGGDGDDTISGDDAAPGTTSAPGGSDTISGGNGNDRIDGEGGSDSIQGDAGDDTLTGGLGRDVLSGAAGDDFLNGDLGPTPPGTLDTTPGSVDACNGGSGIDGSFGCEAKSNIP
jgi:hypothetical protein